MAGVTTSFLTQHGVAMSSDEIDDAVTEAVRSRQVRFGRAPREELTAEQTRLLERGGLNLSPLRAGETLQADRTTADYAALIVTAYTTGQLAKLLGRNPSRIRQRIRARQVFAFQTGRGTDWLVPAFQVAEGTLLPGLAEVTTRLPADMHPLAVERWFLTPNADLVQDDQLQSPRDFLLTGGDPESVAELAENL